MLKEVERYKNEIICSNKFESIAFTEPLSRTIVSIFRLEDGRPKISRIIRRIASERVQSSQNYKEITLKELNSRLSLVYSFPDPDVIFYTGPSCCTQGFMPWQLKLTEFIRLSHDHSFTVDSFVCALYKYNNHHQRFGK